jgi:hypothetical protein
MKQLLILAAGLLISASTLAYKDGTYSCKNIDGLPDNTYKVDTQSATGIPLVDVHRYFKASSSSPKITESHIHGYAVVASTDDGTEIFILGALRMEFDKDVLFGCKQQ